MAPEPVVIVPGFLLTSGRFEEARAALRSLGVAEARVVPVTLPDWGASVFAAGWARILDKIDRTVDRAVHQGYSRAGKLFVKAGLIWDRLEDRTDSLLASLKNLEIFEGSQDQTQR